MIAVEDWFFLSVVIPCFEFHSAGLHSSFVVMTEFLPIYRDTAEYGGQTICLGLLSVDIKQCLKCTSHHDFSFNASILWLNTHLHILRERKETLKLQKQFLWCNLCVPFGHTHVAMPQHLAHRFYRHSLLKCDERGKGMSCRMRGKGKGYADS